MGQILSDTAQRHAEAWDGVDRRVVERDVNDNWRFDLNRRVTNLENDSVTWDNRLDRYHSDQMAAINNRQRQFDAAISVFAIHVKTCEANRWLTVSGWAFAMLVLAVICIKVLSL